MSDEQSSTSLEWLQQRINRQREEAYQLPPLHPERRKLIREIAAMEYYATRLKKGVVMVAHYDPEDRL